MDPDCHVGDGVNDRVRSSRRGVAEFLHAVGDTSGKVVLKPADRLALYMAQCAPADHRDCIRPKGDVIERLARRGNQWPDDQ